MKKLKVTYSDDETKIFNDIFELLESLNKQFDLMKFEIIDQKEDNAKIRDLEFIWTYQDYIDVMDLSDSSENQKNWLQLVAVINRGWSEYIDGEIRQTIRDAHEEEFGSKK
jgi:hypothetical protein